MSADGTAYVSESFRGRIHRLRPGASALEVWAPISMDVIDGLALLADGSLYANNFASGKLFRIPVNTDGSAGASCRSRPRCRSVGPMACEPRVRGR